MLCLLIHVRFVPIADIVSRALLCDLTRMLMSSTKPPRFSHPW